MSAALRRAAYGVGLLVSLWGCRGGLASRGGAGLLGRDPVAAQGFNEQGLTLIAQGCFEQAEECFRQALSADPYWGPARCNLGVAFLRQGKYFDAGWQLRCAVQLMPRAAAPRANLGILYEIAGRLDLGEEHLRQALELAPQDIEIIGHLTRVHVRQGKCTPDTLAWLESITTQDDHPAWRSWAREQLIATQTSDAQERR